MRNYRHTLYLSFDEWFASRRWQTCSRYVTVRLLACSLIIIYTSKTSKHIISLPILLSSDSLSPRPRRCRCCFVALTSPDLSIAWFPMPTVTLHRRLVWELSSDLMKYLLHFGNYIFLIKNSFQIERLWRMREVMTKLINKYWSLKDASRAICDATIGGMNITACE